MMNMDEEKILELEQMEEVSAATFPATAVLAAAFPAAVTLKRSWYESGINAIPAGSKKLSRFPTFIR